MGSYQSFLLGFAILTPQIGGAQIQFPPQAFAKIEGVLDFCAKVNPQHTEEYDKLRKKLVQDIPGENLSELRASQKYKDAYEQARTDFGKMTKEKALKVCSESLEKN